MDMSSAHKVISCSIGPMLWTDHAVDRPEYYLNTSLSGCCKSQELYTARNTVPHNILGDRTWGVKWSMASRPRSGFVVHHQVELPAINIHMEALDSNKGKGFSIKLTVVSFIWWQSPWKVIGVSQSGNRWLRMAPMPKCHRQEPECMPHCNAPTHYLIRAATWQLWRLLLLYCPRIMVLSCWVVNVVSQQWMPCGAGTYCRNWGGQGTLAAPFYLMVYVPAGWPGLWQLWDVGVI